MERYWCRPDWYERDDGEREVKAYDAEDAAKDFARWHDSDNSEYPDEQKVIVRDAKGTEVVFEVRAESVRVYRATEAAK